MEKRERERERERERPDAECGCVLVFGLYFCLAGLDGRPAVAVAVAPWPCVGVSAVFLFAY